MSNDSTFYKNYNNLLKNVCKASNTDFIELFLQDSKFKKFTDQQICNQIHEKIKQKQNFIGQIMGYLTFQNQPTQLSSAQEKVDQITQKLYNFMHNLQNKGKESQIWQILNNLSQFVDQQFSFREQNQQEEEKKDNSQSQIDQNNFQNQTDQINFIFEQKTTTAQQYDQSLVKEIAKQYFDKESMLHNGTHIRLENQKVNDGGNLCNQLCVCVNIKMSGNETHKLIFSLSASSQDTDNFFTPYEFLKQLWPDKKNAAINQELQKVCNEYFENITVKEERLLHTEPIIPLIIFPLILKCLFIPGEYEKLSACIEIHVKEQIYVCREYIKGLSQQFGGEQCTLSFENVDKIDVFLMSTYPPCKNGCDNIIKQFCGDKYKQKLASKLHTDSKFLKMNIMFFAQNTKKVQQLYQNIKRLLMDFVDEECDHNNQLSIQDLQWLPKKYKKEIEQLRQEKQQLEDVLTKRNKEIQELKKNLTEKNLCQEFSNGQSNTGYQNLQHYNQQENGNQNQQQQQMQQQENTVAQTQSQHIDDLQNQLNSKLEIKDEDDK